MRGAARTVGRPRGRPKVDNRALVAAVLVTWLACPTRDRRSLNWAIGQIAADPPPGAEARCRTAKALRERLHRALRWHDELVLLRLAIAAAEEQGQLIPVQARHRLQAIERARNPLAGLVAAFSGAVASLGLSKIELFSPAHTAMLRRVERDMATYKLRYRTPERDQLPWSQLRAALAAADDAFNRAIADK